MELDVPLNYFTLFAGVSHTNNAHTTTATATAAATKPGDNSRDYDKNGKQTRNQNNLNEQKKQSSEIRVLYDHPPLFDVSCNLMHEALNNDLAEHLTLARTHNITNLIVPGSTVQDSEFAAKLAIQINNDEIGLQPQTLLEGGSTASDSNRTNNGTNNRTTQRETNTLRVYTTAGIHPVAASKVRDRISNDSDNDNENENGNGSDNALQTCMKQIEQLICDYGYRRDPNNVAATEVHEGSIESVLPKLKDESPKSSLELQKKNPIVAVGECGLDTSEGFPSLEAQLPVFRAQLDLAAKLKLPLFLHERGAHYEFVKELEDAQDRHNGYLPPLLVHCFTSSIEAMQVYLSPRFDAYISLSGALLRTCKTEEQNAKAREMEQVARLVPLHKLMIETDAPYLGFPGCRRMMMTTSNVDANEQGEGKEKAKAKAKAKKYKRIFPNVPVSLPLVAAGIAQFRDDVNSEHELVIACTENAKRFFFNSNDGT